MLIPLFALFAVIPVSAIMVSPDVQITSPVSEFATNKNSLTVEYTFSAHKDNPGQGALGSVSLIELLVNGEVVQTKDNPPQAKEGEGSFEIDLNIPDQILNTQTCAYQGDIHAGLKGCSEEVRVIVDKTPPEITLIDVPPLYTNNPRPFFKIDYRDNLSGIDHIKVSLNGDEVTEGLNIIEGGLFYQPLIDLEDGSYISEIEVKDKAGNTATSSVTFTIDTVPPEPPSISIDKMQDVNPGVIIEEIEGKIIITLKGSQDRVTIVGEESEPGNRIIVNAPSPLIVGEVEYAQSYRVEISGIVEGKRTVKIIEQDPAGNESITLEVEIDRFIQEIVDFSDIKIEINKRHGLGLGFINNWYAPPGSDEELIELKNNLIDLLHLRVYYDGWWQYMIFRVDKGNDVWLYNLWPDYHEGDIPNIEGLTPEEIKQVYGEFAKKLEWVAVNSPQQPEAWWHYLRSENIEIQYGRGGASGSSYEEAVNKTVHWLTEFWPLPPSWWMEPTYGTDIWVLRNRQEVLPQYQYSVSINTRNYRGNFELPENLNLLAGYELRQLPIRIAEYQVSAVGRFEPGWQYIELDNIIEIPPEPPAGCYYPAWCSWSHNYHHWHLTSTYARVIPPDVEIEKIEITPNPEEGEEAVNVCFSSEQQFTAYAYLHLVYTDGSVSNTFKIRLPLTSNIGIINTDGSFVATESGEGEITASYGGISDSVEVRVVKVDLNIYNGKKGSKVEEVDEETEGAILLVNRDDDNENLVPDYEDPVGDRGFKEDDPARLEIILEPGLNRGLLRLEATGGKEKIRVWESGLYQTQEIILPKTWDLSIETIPLILWVEGIKKSDSVRDVGLKVTYQKGNFTCEDKVKATVVLVHEGCAVYRELTWTPGGNRGHTGILSKYNGQCTAQDLNDDTKYEVLEMMPPLRSINLQQFKELPYWGTYESSDMTYKKALVVIKTARDIVARGNRVEYSWNDVVEPATWWQTPAVANITALRCDGFVEISHEMVDVMVWGKKSANGYNYDIKASQQSQDEHNAGEITEVFWGKYLFPATQCAWEYTYIGTHWNTKLSRKNPANLKPYEPVFSE